MHILMITSKFPPSICGIGDYTNELARSLNEKKIKVTILSKQQNTKLSDFPFPVVELSRNWRFYNIWNLKPVIQQLKPDLVHLQYEPFGFQQSYLLPLILGSLKIPLVMTVHEVFHRYPPEKWRDQYLYSRAKRMIYNDYLTQQRLLKVSPQSLEKSRLLGVGSNFPSVSFDSKRNSNSEIQVGYFGLINRTKKIEVLLDAVHELKKQTPKKIKLVMIGPFDPQSDSYHQQILNLRHQMGLEQQVEFAGGLSKSDVVLRLMDLDMVVLPYLDGASTRHGSFQTCTTLGVPVITTKESDPQSTIKDGEVALLMNQLDSKSVVDLILKMDSDPTIRQRLISGGKNYAKNFSWDQLAQKHLEIYQELLPNDLK